MDLGAVNTCYTNLLPSEESWSVDLILLVSAGKLAE